MAKGGGPWKGVAVLGAVVIIASVLMYYLSASLGAWWQLTIDAGILGTETGYMNAFGIYNVEGSDPEMVLGYLGIFNGILLIIGPLIVLLGSFKESKGLAILGSIINLAAIGLFIYALYNIDSDGALAQFLQALDSSEDYFIHLGDFSFFGIEFTWRIGNGFFICCAGAIIALIGAFKLDV